MLPQPLMLPRGRRVHCTGNCQHSHDEPAGPVVRGGVEMRWGPKLIVSAE